MIHLRKILRSGLKVPEIKHLFDVHSVSEISLPFGSPHSGSLMSHL